MKLIANLASVADVLKPRLVTSAKQYRDPCSLPPTDSTNYRKCVSSFHSSWGQIDNGFFNRPTMVPTQILVHRWGPKAKISALFRRPTEPEFSFVCGAGYIKIGAVGRERGGGGRVREWTTHPACQHRIFWSLPSNHLWLYILKINRQYLNHYNCWVIN